MRLAMVVGISAALGLSTGAAATPARCSCGGGATSSPMSAAATQQTLQAYWALLDAGASPEPDDGRAKGLLHLQSR